MPDERTNALICGSVRTVAQLIPGVGGALAQAWSEYDSIQKAKRSNEFFNKLAARLLNLEQSHADTQTRVKRLEDIAVLLEKSIDRVIREANPSKRELFVVCFVSFLASECSPTPDDRLHVLETLDELTEADLKVLQQFAQTGYSRGDILSGTEFGEWSSVGDDTELQTRQEATVSPLILSTAKLEARGLIVRDANRGAYGESGEPGAWCNRFRRQAWRLMPAGRQLLDAINFKN